MFIERLDRIVRISNERFDASLNPSFDRRFFNRTRVCNSILWSSKRQDFGILDRYFLSPSPLFFSFSILLHLYIGSSSPEGGTRSHYRSTSCTRHDKKRGIIARTTGITMCALRRATIVLCHHREQIESRLCLITVISVETIDASNDRLVFHPLFAFRRRNPAKNRSPIFDGS